MAGFNGWFWGGIHGCDKGSCTSAGNTDTLTAPNTLQKRRGGSTKLSESQVGTERGGTKTRTEQKTLTEQGLSSITLQARVRTYAEHDVMLTHNWSGFQCAVSLRYRSS